jgi:RNA polymerase sigma-70 factor (ECF subfamily)
VRSVNGTPGLVARSGGIPLAVIALDIRRGRVREVWVVADPAKLGGW